jgi:predicted nucleic acid-binding protein
MIYFDTSAFVPIFILEATSRAIVEWLESSREPVAISDWTLVEFAAATSMKLRTGQISVAKATKAAQEMQSFSRGQCLVALPERETFVRAAEWARQPGLQLRAGDALHLAIARQLNAARLACLDNAMIASAGALGFEVVSF